MTITLVTGCFDVLHIGHMKLLRRARALGGYVFVSINSDASIRRLKGESRPVNSFADRMEMLMCCRYVDQVDMFDGDCAASAIRKHWPTFWLKGGDYTMDNITQAERDALNATGCKLITMPRVEGYSTTKIVGNKKPSQ